MPSVIKHTSSEYFDVTLESHIIPGKPSYIVKSTLDELEDSKRWVEIKQNLKTRHLEPILRQTNILTNERIAELMKQIKDAQRLCNRVNKRIDDYVASLNQQN